MGTNGSSLEGVQIEEIEGRQYTCVKSVAAPTALILCLHGGKGSAKHFRDSVGHQFEATPGILVVYPDGGVKGGGWSDGRVAGDTRSEVEFLTKIISREKARFPSIRQVCCTGMSNGAMMTFAMMREHTGLIDCYAPVCGLLPRWTDGSSLPANIQGAKVVLIVGMQDRFIPVGGGAVGRVLRSQQSLQGGALKPWEQRREARVKEIRGEVRSLEDTCGALEAMLGVRISDRKPLGSGRTYSAEERKSEDGRLRVITVQEMGHSWPGSVGFATWIPGVGTTATFSAGEEILATLLND